MNAVVREAVPADLEQIIPLFVDSVDTSLPGVQFSDKPGYTYEKLHPVLLKRLFVPPSRKVYVVELPSGDITGYANVKGDSKLSHDSEEIDMFFVKADMGRLGYGGLLMKAMQKGWGERGLWIVVFERNEHARRFYEKHGFVLVYTKLALELGIQGTDEEMLCVLRWSRST